MAAGPEKELAQLDRVFDAIVNANSAEALEKTLGKFLAAIINKFGSPHEVVHKKVMDILSHVNKRIAATPVKLPFEVLAELYNDPKEAPRARAFALLYLVKMPPENAIDHVPKLLVGVSSLPSAQQGPVLHMALKVIDRFPKPEDEEAYDKFSEFLASSKDVDCLLEFLLDVVLSSSSTQQTVPSGMSKRALDRVRSGSAVSPEEWTAAKASIVDLCARGFFEANNVLPLLLAASVDHHHSVNSKGDMGMKRLVGMNREDGTLVSKLFTIFNGTGKQAATADEIRSPPAPAMRVKIVDQLCMSRLAANSFPETLKVVFECLYGTATTAKLRHSGMAFVQWVFRHATDAQLKPMAPIILQGLLKFLRESAESAEASLSEIREFAYVAIGQLGNRAPELFASDLSTVRLLFDALTCEILPQRQAPQEGLCLLCKIYTDCADEVRSDLITILRRHMVKPSEHARYMAAYFACRAFPYAHVPARIVSLSLGADPSGMVRSEAARGLAPYSIRDKMFAADAEAAPPSFSGLAVAVAEAQLGKAAVVSSGPLDKRSADEAPISSMKVVLEFLFDVFSANAKEAGLGKGEFVDSLAPTGEIAQSSALDAFIGMVMDELTPANATAPENRAASAILLELSCIKPRLFSPLVIHRLSTLERLLRSQHGETRENAAKIVGIATVCMDEGARADLLARLITEAETERTSFALEARHGAMMAFGASLARCAEAGVSPGADLAGRGASVLAAMLRADKPPPALLVGGACECLGHLGATGPLPGGCPALEVMERLVALMSSEDTRVREKAIAAAGHLCVGSRDPVLVKAAVEGLFALASVKNELLHFVVGEALVCAGSGGTPVRAEVDPNDFVAVYAAQAAPTVEEKDNVLAETVERILKATAASNAQGRKSAATWMLCLVQFAGGHQAVKSRLMEIQRAFSALLTDRDGFTQECASRGMGIVYDQGDEAIKEELLQALVRMLSMGKSAVKTGDDEEVFAEGELGKTPDGEGLSTYKQLCSLANDMGKPELIYKFMAVASHNAVWNSRKGAAFGMSSIAAKAGDQLAPYLPKLIPKLYQYQFDPNPRVADAMRTMWLSMAPDKATTTFFPLIVEELLGNMGSRTWRSRQAAALALADLVPGKEVEEVEAYIERMWTMTFRVVDDIKETVRKAGLRTASVMSSLTLRMCDPEATSAASGAKALAVVLPFLLKKGVVSDAAEVRKFSMDLVLKITRKAGRLLRPHVPDLVVVLLETMSTLEPQELNYLQLNAQKYGVDESHVESARLSIAGGSRLMDTLNTALGEMDAGVLEALVPQLVSLARHGTGLPTKVGCSKVVISLCFSHPADMKGFAQKLLKPFKQGLGDRSPSVRSAYATAIAYLAKVAKKTTVSKLIVELREMYLAGVDSDDKRHAAGVVINEMAKHASDQLKANFVEILPTAFLARSDPADKVRAVWARVWEDNTPGLQGGLRLYHAEIVPLLATTLSSASWNFRIQAATALSDAAKAPDMDAHLAHHMASVLPALTAALGGRTWDGKEAVLGAFVDVIIAAKAWKQDSNDIEEPPAKKAKLADSSVPGPRESATLVLSECKRKSLAYRRLAVQHLGRLLKAYDDAALSVDGLYADCLDVLGEFAFNEGGASEDDDPKNKPLLLLVRAAAIKALTLALPHQAPLQRPYVDDLVEKLASMVAANVWNVRVAAAEALQRLLEKLDVSAHDAVITAVSLRKILDGAFAAFGDLKYAAVRTAALRMVTTAFLRADASAALSSALDPMRADVREHVGKLTGDANSSIASTARDLLAKV